MVEGDGGEGRAGLGYMINQGEGVGWARLEEMGKVEKIHFTQH